MQCRLSSLGDVLDTEPTHQRLPSPRTRQKLVPKFLKSTWATSYEHGKGSRKRSGANLDSGVHFHEVEPMLLPQELNSADTHIPN